MLKKTLTVVVATLICVLAIQAVAMAATPDKLYLRVWPEYLDSQVSFLEAVEYSPATPLPIEVKVAIPKGATITWAGEILGGAPENDIQATPKITSKGDYDEVVFTLTKGRIGQVETSLPALKSNGNDRSVTLDWVQRFPANQTVFEFREPTQASDLKMNPPAASLDTGQDGTRFHTTVPVALAVGQKQTFSATYKRSITGPSDNTQPAQTTQQGQPSQAPAAGSTPSSTNAATIVLVVVMATVIIFVAYLQKKAAKTHSAK